MTERTRYFIDHMGRLVRRVQFHGKEYAYYFGNNTQGIIEHDADGDYIVVDGQKRYWRGIAEQIPDELLFLKDFSICILKPDARRSALEGEIRGLISNNFTIITERDILLNREKIFRLYPYFFTSDFEIELLKYLSSGPSCGILVSGHDIIKRAIELRNYIRLMYNHGEKKHPVYNLVHSADNQEEAIRGALQFFTADELICLIGLKE